MDTTRSVEEHVFTGRIDRFLYGKDEDEVGERLIIWRHLMSCATCMRRFKDRWKIRTFQKAVGLESSDLTEECVDFTQLHIDEDNQADVLKSIGPHLIKCGICRTYCMLSLGLVVVDPEIQPLLFPPPGEKADPELFPLDELEKYF